MKKSVTKQVTRRAVIIGLFLIPFNCYFLVNNHIHLSGLPTTISLFYNVVMCLALLVGINWALKRFLPRSMLSRGELLTIYVMLAIASSMSGHDMLQTVVPVLTHGFWYATPENDWQRLFWRYLPDWLMMGELKELPAYYHGETSLFSISRMKLWVVPTIWWTIFFTMLVMVMVCINLILRRRWIEQERLAYPVIQLPAEITADFEETKNRKGSLFKSRLMWIGVGLAASLALINGLHHLFPNFPGIPNRNYEIGALFTQKPWNAIGWTPVYLFPFAIGLSFFMPLSLSFSVWFFYWFWKALRVFGSIMGIRSLPGFPYSGQQTTGGYIAIVLLALWGGRRHISHVIKTLLSPGDKDERTQYRFAFLGLAFGVVFLVFFARQAGMAMWAALLYFALYFTLGLSITRIRAELGPPTHEMYDSTPHNIMVTSLGTRRLGVGNLTVLSLFWGFNRGYRAHPMPHTLEAFKLAETGKMEIGKLSLAMILAAMLGAFSTYWVFIEMSYRLGANGNPPWGGFRHLQNWLYYAKPTDYLSLSFMGVGMASVGLLHFLRLRFFWWQLHPAGFALTGSTWTVGWLWFSIFISWFAKWLILRFGGIGTYRKAVPLFLGLLLGDYIFGGMWIVIRLVFGIDTYVFWR